MYKIIKGNDKCIVLETEDTISSIPTILENSDYQKYLQWLEEGNEPEIIDPVE